MEEKENYAEEQAEAQLSSIREMLAALNVDYDRLEGLKEELESLQAALVEAIDTLDAEEAQMNGFPPRWEGACSELNDAADALYTWGQENHDEFSQLKSDAGDCESRDDAEQRIQEDPLSVQIRSGWYTPGAEPAHSAENFEILLCTGGPAVRIMGELGEHNDPDRAWLEYQDWGTPWTSYYEPGIGETLLEYAQQFWYGG